MPEKITLRRRGVVTLPSKIRKRYGLKERDDLIVEETPEGLLLKPAVSVPVELYSEERIAEFQEDDDALGKVLNK